MEISTKLSLFGLTACAAYVAAAPAAVRATPDPYQIFANAREYWLQQRYPERLRYQIAVDVTEAGKERVEHYDASFEAVENIVDVDPTSDYERAHPVRPTGVDLNFMIVRLNKPLPSADFLGVPHLAPNYSFGMAPFVPAPTPTPFDSSALVAEIRKEFRDPNPRASAPAPSPSPGLAEIASVIAHNRDYAISLLGTDTIDGHPCYHLALRPMREPGKYRIREAWIDETTYAPWQLKDAVNFVYGPATAVPWTIRFADIQGAHYVSEERADAAMSVRGQIYTQAAIRFESIVATDATPRPKLPGASEDVLDEP